MEQVVVLTGAGMSADSGLKTFRDSNGLWEGVDINKVATIEGWQRDPSTVLAFYNARRKQAHEAKPHAGHKALAQLEQFFEVNIITQNVDNLHERAGSSNVIHLHGELNKVRSVKDASITINVGGNPVEMGDTAKDGAQLRPDVVWFGEMVPNMKTAAGIITDADIFIVIGTSLVVYPAAGLIDYVHPKVPKYVIDPTEPELPDLKNWTHIRQKAEHAVPNLIERLNAD